MYRKNKNYEINKSILKEYHDNALQNAMELLNEAQLLLTHKHYARAYYLACLSMEESGKAYIAWTAQGRNLDNQGIHKTLKDRFELHPSKIMCAFYCWALVSSDLSAAITHMTDLQTNLINGREKSMYVDIKDDNTIMLPSKIIRPVAARDCVEVAKNCLHATKYYIAKNDPTKYSSIEDKFFCMNHEKLFTMMSQNEDFGYYLMDHINSGSVAHDFIKCIVTYHEAYFCKNKKYKSLK